MLKLTSYGTPAFW